MITYKGMLILDQNEFRTKTKHITNAISRFCINDGCLIKEIIDRCQWRIIKSYEYIKQDITWKFQFESMYNDIKVLRQLGHKLEGIGKDKFYEDIKWLADQLHFVKSYYEQNYGKPFKQKPIL